MVYDLNPKTPATALREFADELGGEYWPDVVDKKVIQRELRGRATAMDAKKRENNE